MSESAFQKITCPHCGVHIEYPDDSEGQVAPCPKCGSNVLLNNQRKPAAPAPANQNAEPSFIDSAVIGIIVGIIVALGIGVACLVSSKMGWDGLGSFMSNWRARIFDMGIWVGVLTMPPVILVISFLQKKKNQTYKDALKDGAFVSCFTIGLLSCFLMTFQLFYSTPQQNQTASKPVALKQEDLKSKAEGGDANAQYNLGSAYFNGNGVAKDEAEAVNWWRKAAEQNFANAQYILGACYYHGQGVTKDEAEAVKWWLKAAQQNNPEAQFGLGICYFNGEGVEKSQEQAVIWWRKAAEQNHTLAQSWLGRSYANGQGVSVNWDEASKWLQLASDKGDSYATKLLIDRKNMDDAAKAALDKIQNGDPSFHATVVPIAETSQVTATNVTAKVTESNASYWKWTWKLTLVNYSSDPVNVNTAVQFFDKDGYLVDEDKYGVQNAVLPARSWQTFTGLKMIRLPATKNVASVGAKVEVQ